MIGITEKERELAEIYNRLDTAGQEEFITLVLLVIHSPGFNEECAAATPAGDITPPGEVVRALVKKWAPTVAKYKHSADGGDA